VLRAMRLVIGGMSTQHSNLEPSVILRSSLVPLALELAGFPPSRSRNDLMPSTRIRPKRAAHESSRLRYLRHSRLLPATIAISSDIESAGSPVRISGEQTIYENDLIDNEDPEAEADQARGDAEAVA
jgi:hypothetical protein